VSLPDFVARTTASLMNDDRLVGLKHQRPCPGGSILTLPAATLDLQDWMGDQRWRGPVSAELFAHNLGHQ
jgi:hypothetical protein